MKESHIQKAIMQYLQAKGILALRQNTGGMVSTYNGKTRFTRFGLIGQADIVCWPNNQTCWIEVKTAKGKQSEFQKSFQQLVEFHGQRYILARSVDDVIQALEGRVNS